MSRTVATMSGHAAPSLNSWIIANCEAPAKTRTLVATISAGARPAWSATIPNERPTTNTVTSTGQPSASAARCGDNLRT